MIKNLKPLQFILSISLSIALTIIISIFITTAQTSSTNSYLKDDLQVKTGAKFNAGGSSQVTIDTSGQVGIGSNFKITSAGAVSGATGNISMWTNNSGYITDGNTGWDNSYGYITSSVSGNFSATGNVGIGVEPSGAKLEVSDSIRIVPRSSEPFTCASTKKGSMYFNSSTNKHMLCNGTSWVDYTGPTGATGATGPTGTYSFRLCQCGTSGPSWGPEGQGCSGLRYSCGGTECAESGTYNRNCRQ